MARLGQEHRLARTGSGLSLREVAAASGASHQQLLRFERAELERVSVAELGAWCAVVGLDLAIRAFPDGDPIRDAGQQRLLARLRVRLHAALHWATEVPLPIENDRRAWDAVIRGGDWRIGVEAETVLVDLQAVERRLSLKQRDGAVDYVILLVADTRRNRRALAAAPAAFAGLRRDARATLRALAAGRDPGGSTILVL
jgi:transcriptional regulator with XRE-family HTH domain